MVTAKLDTGYRSKGLFGIWKYDFTERSADVPGELSSWTAGFTSRKVNSRKHI